MRRDSGLPVEEVADQVLRIEMPRRFDLRQGEYVCLYHKVYGGNCIYFGDCDLCTLRDVTVHSFPGMGFYCTDRSTNITLERYRVERPESTTRLTSTNADGSKYVHTGGMLTIKDCYYEGMGDDAINIHSSYGKVVRQDGKTLSIARIRGAGKAMFRLGMYCRVIRWSFMTGKRWFRKVLLRFWTVKARA